MLRSDVINSIADKIGAKSYLEVGVQTGKTFNEVKVERKVGVDPDPFSKATIHITSDLYFSLNNCQDTYDIIFVDGLHHWETALRDIHNSLAILNEGGYILVDDIYPKKEVHQRRNISDVHWTGDVWKAWWRATHECGHDFEFISLDVAFGLGIIRKGKTKIFPSNLDVANSDWNDFVREKDALLKVLPIEEFESFIEKT